MAFIISHKYKFVYVHIPKTGGTSLCQANLPNRPRGGYLADVLPKTDLTIPHARVSYAAKYLWDYTFWATLRNPYDRFISVYLRGCSVHGWRPFSQFIDEVAFNKISLTYAFLPQTHWVTYNGEIPIDHFVNFERLVPETMRTLEWLGVPHDKPFPHLKKSVRKPWREYYTEDDLYEVRQIYKGDFKLYEQQFRTQTGNSPLND